MTTGLGLLCFGVGFVVGVCVVVLALEFYVFRRKPIYRI